MLWHFALKTRKTWVSFLVKRMIKQLLNFKTFQKFQFKNKFLKKWLEFILEFFSTKII